MDENGVDVDAAITEELEDKEFDPPIEMMIHDYDDERTLDDEEALEEEADDEVLDELSELQKDNEIPLAELFAMHGYGEVHPNNAENDIEAIIEDDCGTMDTESISINPKITSSQVLQMYVEDEEDLYSALDFSNSGMYKTTRVGDEYQAQVPAGTSSTDTNLDPHYGAPDTLLWDPSHLSENQVEAFNKATEQGSQRNGECWVKDNDEYLYSLMQCNFNIEEALRRHSFNSVNPVTTTTLWTEQEVDKFENGMCTYGKDFFKIHQNKLPSKSVMDIIKFYYLHKKSPRHSKLVTRTDVKISKRNKPYKISANRNLQFLENLLGSTSAKTMAAEA